jgi:hypothetical protein
LGKLQPILGGAVVITAAVGASLQGDVGSVQTTSPKIEQAQPSQKVGSDQSVDLPYLEKQIAEAEAKAVEKQKAAENAEALVAAKQKEEAELTKKLEEAEKNAAAAFEKAAVEKTAAAEKAAAEETAAAEKAAAEKAAAAEQTAAAEKAAAEETAAAEKAATEKVAAETTLEKAAAEAKAATEKKQADLAEQLAADEKAKAPAPFVNQIMFGEKKLATTQEPAGLFFSFGDDDGLATAAAAVAAVAVLAAAAAAATGAAGKLGERESGASKSPPADTSKPKVVEGDSYVDALTGGVPIEIPTASTTKPASETKPTPVEVKPPPAAAKAESAPAPAAEISGAAVSSYMDNLSGPATAGPKKSYSPFGKSTAKPTSNGSYFDSLVSGGSSSDSSSSPSSTSSSASSAATGGTETTTKPPEGAYLEALSVASSIPAKKSYSPFGGSKPKAVAGSDSLYAPPASTRPPVESSTPPSATSSAPVETKSPPESSSASGGSYLEVLGGSAAAAPVKKSYSPFGSKPFAASSSDSLYAPPATTSAPVQPVESSTPSAETSSASGGSYLEALGGSAAVSPVKKSYSPFGSKPFAASSSDSLYAPPATTSAPVQPVRSSTSSAETNSASGGSYLEALGGSAAVAPVKKSYSPFGSKPFAASSSDSLYAPPSTQPESNSANGETNGEAVNGGNGASEASYLSDPSSADTPVVKTSFSPFGDTTAPGSAGAPAPVKKSFSPFGSKPWKP